MNNDEKPSFYFNDFLNRFQFTYCETEDDVKGLCWDKDDRYTWDGPGIYYVEQDFHHCSGDTYYTVQKMPATDVQDLLDFCRGIENKFTTDELVKMGWKE